MSTPLAKRPASPFSVLDLQGGALFAFLGLDQVKLLVHADFPRAFYYLSVGLFLEGIGRTFVKDVHAVRETAPVNELMQNHSLKDLADLRVKCPQREVAGD